MFIFFFLIIVYNIPFYLLQMLAGYFRISHLSFLYIAYSVKHTFSFISKATWPLTSSWNTELLVSLFISSYVVAVKEFRATSFLLLFSSSSFKEPVPAGVYVPHRRPSRPDRLPQTGKRKRKSRSSRWRRSWDENKRKKRAVVKVGRVRWKGILCKGGKKVKSGTRKLIVMVKVEEKQIEEVKEDTIMEEKRKGWC